MGDRTAIPPYDYDHMRVVAHDMPPIVRASWFRGVSALPNTFAHESYIDELADRGRRRSDRIPPALSEGSRARSISSMRWPSAPAGSRARCGRSTKAEGDIVRGRGFAYALYVHSKFPGYGAAWSAWIADVAVNKATGDVSVTRVVAGQDSGLMINPDGVRHQIHGNVIQSTSRALMEEVSFDRGAGDGREWGAYPIIKFPDVPKIDVLMLPRQDQPPLGVGESASVPSAAAIANAIYRCDRRTLSRIAVHAGTHSARDCTAKQPRERRTHCRHRSLAAVARQMAKSVCRRGAACWRPPQRSCAAVVGIGAAVLPWRSIAPIARPDASVYSAATIARGQQLAALGDCAVCHTASNGVLNAGGRAARDAVRHHLLDQHHARCRNRHRRLVLSRLRARDARRHPSRRQASLSGISLHAFRQDDRRRPAGALRLSDGADAGARRQSQTNALAFPFNLRPLLAGWNALFHDAETVPARRNQIADLESRRLSGRRPRPLQRLPFAAQRARRGKGKAPISPAALPKAGRRRR